jgi:hypothetical protein
VATPRRAANKESNSHPSSALSSAAKPRSRAPKALSYSTSSASEISSSGPRDEEPAPRAKRFRPTPVYIVRGLAAKRTGKRAGSVLTKQKSPNDKKSTRRDSGSDSDSESDDDIELVDPDLRPGVTLTVFYRPAFNRAMVRQAAKHAKKLINKARKAESSFEDSEDDSDADRPQAANGNSHAVRTLPPQPVIDVSRLPAKKRLSHSPVVSPTKAQDEESSSEDSEEIRYQRVKKMLRAPSHADIVRIAHFRCFGVLSC